VKVQLQVRGWNLGVTQVSVYVELLVKLALILLLPSAEEKAKLPPLQVKLVEEVSEVSRQFSVKVPAGLVTLEVMITAVLLADVEPPELVKLRWSAFALNNANKRETTNQSGCQRMDLQKPNDSLRICTSFRPGHS
jgi:hypothetical protein